MSTDGFNRTAESSRSIPSWRLPLLTNRTADTYFASAMYFWPPTNTNPSPKMSTSKNVNEDTTAKNEGGAKEMRFCSPAKVNTKPPSNTQNTNQRVKFEGYMTNATTKAAKEANMPKPSMPDVPPCPFARFFTPKYRSAPRSESKAKPPKTPLVMVQSSNSDAPEPNLVPQKMVWFRVGLWYLV